MSVCCANRRPGPPWSAGGGWTSVAAVSAAAGRCVGAKLRDRGIDALQFVGAEPLGFIRVILLVALLGPIKLGHCFAGQIRLVSRCEKLAEFHRVLHP